MSNRNMRQHAPLPEQVSDFRAYDSSLLPGMFSPADFTASVEVGLRRYQEEG